VYVAVIGQATHHLAEHVSVRGLAEFAVVFALIWIAWINGSLYLEVHGRQDGRTRTIVFVQMGILVLLAVFTAEATDGSGRGFAVVYATFQVLQTGLWYSVWLRDRRDGPQYQAATGGYVSARSCSASWPACPRPSVMPPRSSPGCWRCGWASASGGSTSTWWDAGCPEPTVSRCRTG
jgi:hypothetical protein